MTPTAHRHIAAWNALTSTDWHAIEHVFAYDGRVWQRQREQIERWWNGRYGRLARREVRLYHEIAERWTVESAQGDIDSNRVKALHFDTEDAARAYLNRCRDAVPDTDWKPLS